MGNPFVSSSELPWRKGKSSEWGFFILPVFRKTEEIIAGSGLISKKGAENIDKINAWAADGKMIGLKNFRCYRVGNCGRMWVNVEEVEGYVYE